MNNDALGCSRLAQDTIYADVAVAHITEFPVVALPERPWVDVPADKRNVRAQVGRRKVSITLPERVRSPLVVNYGLGTDSTGLLAIMVAMYKAGNLDARPDLIIFADTGSEKPETYAYLAEANAFLAANGFPEVTVVSKRARGTSKDSSLHGSCLRLETMPSLAYGGKSCSLKWKAAEMDIFLGSWMPAILARAAGLPVVKLIGYDGSPADMRRSKSAAEVSKTGQVTTIYAYPLRDAGITRPILKGCINLAGMKQPGKSACFMCPGSKKAEVVQLAKLHPALARTALQMEAAALAKTAAEGRPMTTVGLGRNWSWASVLDGAGIVLEAQQNAA
jgi:hypothetical protein